MSKTLVFGDSMCRGLKIPGADVQCHPGYTTQQLIDLDHIGLEMYLQEEDYDTVVVMAGTNDVGYGFDSKVIVTNISKLIEKCSNVKLIMLVGIRIQSNDCETLDNALFDYCQQNKFVYCDVLEDLEDEYVDEDGIHLSKRGNLYVSEHIFNLIQG